jgi:hypothetical protein
MIDCLPQIHLAALHAEGHYNTFVPGLAVLCTKDDNFVSAGAYDNSIGNASAYAVGGRYLGKVRGLQYGVAAGTVNGYPANAGGFIPMAGAVISWSVGPQMDVHLLLVPAVQNYTPAFVQLSVSFR